MSQVWFDRPLSLLLLGPRVGAGFSVLFLWAVFETVKAAVPAVPSHLIQKTEPLRVGKVLCFGVWEGGDAGWRSVSWSSGHLAAWLLMGCETANPPSTAVSNGSRSKPVKPLCLCL